MGTLQMDNVYRRPQLISEELSDLQDLIRENEKLILKYQNRFSLKLGLQNLKDREEHLLLELEDSMARFQMDTFYFVLDGDVVDNHRVSLSFFGDLMSTLQEIISSIAQSTIAKPTMKGTIQKSILDASKLDLVATAPSSFKVVLSSHEPQLNDSIAKISFQRFHNLIECQDNKHTLKEVSEQLGKRTLLKYKNFVELIYKNNAYVKLYEKTAPEEFNVSEISSNLARRIYDVIIEVENFPDETVIFEGVLKGISLVRYNFEFLIKDSDELITGKFENILIDEVKNRLDMPTIAKFNVNTTLSDITEDEKKEWNLISFEN